MKTFVKARVSVDGIHHWPGAPDCYAVLRHEHRHVFTVEAEAETIHGDREIEFIDLGVQVKNFLLATYPTHACWRATNFGARSCEMIAGEVLDAFAALRRVTVWEDMENAGGAERE
jgi:hypothetical protein